MSNVAPSQHASIVAYVLDVLELERLLPREKRDVAGKRMFVLLTENPTWGVEQLEAHCVGRIKAQRAAQQATPAAEVECWKCSGTGIYQWGGSNNGIPRCTGKCYNCAGKGIETPKDTRRNTTYWNYNGWTHAG